MQLFSSGKNDSEKLVESLTAQIILTNIFLIYIIVSNNRTSKMSF